MNEEQKQRAKSDFIPSILICIVGLVVFFLSLAMPKYEEWGLYATPSLAPMVFSLALFLCGLIILVRSIVAKGYHITLSREQVVRFFTSTVVKRFVIALGLVVVYYLFFGVLHFVVISALYLFLNMFYNRSVVWWKNLIISVVYAAAIWYLFNFVFLIPMP